MPPPDPTRAQPGVRPTSTEHPWDLGVAASPMSAPSYVLSGWFLIVSRGLVLLFEADCIFLMMAACGRLPRAGDTSPGCGGTRAHSGPKRSWGGGPRPSMQSGWGALKPWIL